MKPQEAIMAFCQSEKIKAGIIWISQSIQLLEALPEPERKGGIEIIKSLTSMITHEIRLGERHSSDISWADADRYVEQATVMIDSGVAFEAVSFLTKALSNITNIGQRSMSLLKEQGLL